MKTKKQHKAKKTSLIIAAAWRRHLRRAYARAQTSRVMMKLSAGGCTLASAQARLKKK